jgi:hypothetical protein
MNIGKVYFKRECPQKDLSRLEEKKEVEKNMKIVHLEKI